MVANQTPTTPQPRPAGRPASAPARSKTPATRGESPRRGVATPSLVTFFQESRAELRKVTWPTRQETMNLTGAVIAMTIGIAVFLGIIDEILNQLIKPIIGG